MNHSVLPSLALTILVSATQAPGDGFFAPKLVAAFKDLGSSAKMVASPRQEAIIAVNENTTQMVLRTHFRAGPKELAWIVPVPGRPTEIMSAQDDVFDKLDALTAPQFHKLVFVRGGGGFKLGCSGTAPGSVVISPTGVKVLESGSAGIFQYAVLSAEGTGELTKWLKDNEYAVPPNASKVLEQYVARKWFWLAMRVRPAAAGKATLAPHPVTYTYQSPELVYPMIVSQLSPDAHTEVVLYVVGQGRYECRNWANTDTDSLARGTDPNTGEEYDVSLMEQAGSPSGTNYEDVLKDLTMLKNGHLFITEFSKRWEIFGCDGHSRRIDDVVAPGLVGAWRQQHVTRLRAIIKPEAMDRDVELRLMEDSPRWGVGNHFYISAAAPASPPIASAAFPLLPAAMLSLGLYFRRIDGVLGKSGIALILLGCVVFAML